MKKLLTLLLCVAMLFAFAACGADQAPADNPAETPAEIVGLVADEEVILTFEGASAEQMTMGEFKALPMQEVELSRTNSKGETVVGVYTGVLWTDLAAAIGASAESNISIIASDDYQMAYTPTELNAEGSIFAIAKDGEAISPADEAGKVWFCASESLTANYWGKYIVKIVVEGE